MADHSDPLRLDAPPVVFCTDTVADAAGERMRETHPGAEIVPLVGDRHLGPDDLARITVAFFSGDAYPARTTHVMRVCLEASNLRWMHTFSAGVDHPVFRSFVDRGVALTTSSGASASPIAQTVMMYFLALSRDLPGWMRSQAAHHWDQRRIDELEGRTVAVIGMGPIGLEVVRLATAFGMRPIGVRRSVRGDEPCETWTFDRLRELMSIVDDVVVAVPLTDETRRLVDADLLAALRPGAMFVNVGRGEVVDEEALLASLRSGHLRGAGLDVFATEPLPADSPLWDEPNVIVTPHSSGASERSDDRAVDIFLDNLGRLRNGVPLHNRV